MSLDTAPGPSEKRRLLALLSRPPAEAAAGLLGHVLVRRRPGQKPHVVRIVEAEAYLGAGDPAAHAYRGRTSRTAPLWEPPGTIYVYFVYGMHHCLNLAVDREGSPGCVLIRAAEPLPGQALDPDACRGPGRLCRSLGIDRGLSGQHVFQRRSVLLLREGNAPDRIAVSVRVGVRLAADRPLRFFDPNSTAVSRTHTSRRCARRVPPGD